MFQKYLSARMLCLKGVKYYIVKLPEEHVGFILHNYLTVRKFCSKAVKRLVTAGQKQREHNTD